MGTRPMSNDPYFSGDGMPRPRGSAASARRRPMVHLGFLVGVGICGSRGSSITTSPMEDRFHQCYMTLVADEKLVVTMVSRAQTPDHTFHGNGERSRPCPMPGRAGDLSPWSPRTVNGRWDVARPTGLRKTTRLWSREMLSMPDPVKG